MTYNMQAIADLCRMEVVTLSTTPQNISDLFSTALPANVAPLQVVITAIDANVQYQHKVNAVAIDLPAFDAVGGEPKTIPSHDVLDFIQVFASAGTPTAIIEVYYAK